MRASDYLSYTWRNITRAHLRLLLTVAAVVIGTTLVVVMTSVGGGIQQNVLEDIRAAGGLNEILVTGAAAAQPGTGAAVGERFFDASRQRATPPERYGQTVTLLAQRVVSAPGGGAGQPPPGFGGQQAPGGFGAPVNQVQRRETPLEVVGLLAA